MVIPSPPLRPATPLGTLEPRIIPRGRKVCKNGTIQGCRTWEILRGRITFGRVAPATPDRGAADPIHEAEERRERMTRSLERADPSQGGTVALALESDGPGGAEWMLIHLAVGLRERGARVVPILPERGVGWLGGELRARGFEPRSFRLDHPLDVGCVLRMRRLFDEEGVSVLHAHEFTMSVFGTAAAGLAGVPSILTLHSAQGFPDRLRRRVALRWAVRRAAQATTVSEATREVLCDRLGMAPEAWEVVPNGVPLPLGDRSAGRADLGVAPGTTLLLALGSLYRVKGHDVLLRAAAILAERTDLPPWAIRIAGRGGEMEGLQALLAELSLEDRVRLVGFREEVGSLLHAADLFVHPSRNEGLPLALIEAMAVGLPVVASRVGGIPEAVRDEVTGILVPPENPAALADAMARLLQDPEGARRLGEAGRREAGARYGIEVMIDRYLDLYRGARRGR